jgi:hypothetical protein
MLRSPSPSFCHLITGLTVHPLDDVGFQIVEISELLTDGSARYRYTRGHD